MSQHIARRLGLLVHFTGSCSVLNLSSSSINRVVSLKILDRRHTLGNSFKRIGNQSLVLALLVPLRAQWLA